MLKNVFEKTTFRTLLIGGTLLILGGAIAFSFLTPKETIPPRENAFVSDKGLELFDGNTWAKGERELYLLEMRGLKGQLEKEIEQFNGVKRAFLMLDVPQIKPSFKKEPLQAKASLVLELKDGMPLSSQEVSAMVQHIVAGIGGLSSNWVAVSDTKGKIYRSFNSEGMDMPFREDVLPSDLEEKIETMVNEKLSNFLNQFEAKIPLKKETTNFLQWTLVILGIVLSLGLLALVWRFLPSSKPLPKRAEEEEILETKSIQEMAETLQKESPRKAALFLCSISEDQASDLFQLFSDSFQEAVLAEILHLEEMPQEESQAALQEVVGVLGGKAKPHETILSELRGILNKPRSG